MGLNGLRLCGDYDIVDNPGGFNAEDLGLELTVSHKVKIIRREAQQPLPNPPEVPKAPYTRRYSAAVSGLTANESCGNEDVRLVNEGYLLSMKAFAEHYTRGDDEWHTDFNQANQLLVECQTKPGLYGTRIAAECETQEHYNISAETDWDIASRQ